MNSFEPRSNSYESTLTPEILKIIRNYEFYSSEDDEAEQVQTNKHHAPEPEIPMDISARSAGVYAPQSESCDAGERHRHSERSSKPKIIAVIASVLAVGFAVCSLVLCIKYLMLKNDYKELEKDNSSYAKEVKALRDEVYSSKDSDEEAEAVQEDVSEEADDTASDESDDSSKAEETKSKKKKPQDLEEADKESKADDADSIDSEQEDTDSKEKTSGKKEDDSSSVSDVDTEYARSNGLLEVDEEIKFEDEEEFVDLPFSLMQDQNEKELVLIAYYYNGETNYFKPAYDGTCALVSTDPEDDTRLEYDGVYYDEQGNKSYIYKGSEEVLGEEKTYYYKYIVSDGSEEE